MPLPAYVQPQVWVNDNAIDEGGLIYFDAEEALVRQLPHRFSFIANEILCERHDIDELALDEFEIKSWLADRGDHTLQVTVEREDFQAWLAEFDLREEQAVDMDQPGLEALRERVAAAAAAPAP